MVYVREQTPGGAQAEVSFDPVVKLNAVTTGITYTSRSGGYIIDKDNICKGWAKAVLSSKGAEVGALTMDLPIPVKSGAVGTVIIGARAKIAHAVALEAKLDGGSNSIVFFDYALNGASSIAIDDADLSNDSSIEITFQYPVA